jgi:hypothetical protein
MSWPEVGAQVFVLDSWGAGWPYFAEYEIIESHNDTNNSPVYVGVHKANSKLVWAGPEGTDKEFTTIEDIELGKIEPRE